MLPAPGDQLWVLVDPLQVDARFGQVGPVPQDPPHTAAEVEDRPEAQQIQAILGQNFAHPFGGLAAGLEKLIDVIGSPNRVKQVGWRDRNPLASVRQAKRYTLRPLPDPQRPALHPTPSSGDDPR